MSISEPGKIITPWAESGLKNPIPPAANPATGRAGFDQGFSAINMTAKEAGGIPPFGQDFNGIFYEITKILQYMQAGGRPTFSADLMTAIGGYPVGAILCSDDGMSLFRNTVDGNSTNPNLGGDGWARTDLQVMELYRRSYAEAGYNVVGTFQAGFTIASTADVGIDLDTGKGYTGPVGNVAPNTNPASGGFVDVSGSLLRSVVISEDPMKGLFAIPVSSADQSTNDVGQPLQNSGEKLSSTYSRSSNPSFFGTFKSPEELEIRTGQLVYWTRGGAAGLVTDLSKYFPRGFNLGPRSAEAAGLKAYYVTQTGSDANDGLSWTTALASITTAANKSDADVVFINAGPWAISNGFTGKTLSRDLVLCCPEGEAFISNQRNTTWTNNGDGTYTSATLGGTPIRVADLRYTDEFGDPVWFSKKTSLAEVQATPYSWAVTAGSGSTQVVTINLPGLTPVNESTLVLRSAPVQVDFNAQPFKFYAKNICFFGGDSSSMTPKNGVDGSVYASENCRYLSPHLNDCLRVQGVGLAISIGCKASNGEKDGFNYHAATNTGGVLVQSHFIEIDCTSHNHKTTAGTANGSTAHESCIGFRIGCSYGYGVGPGVADIGDSKTFCVSCTSNGGYGDSNAKGFLPADNCRMWLHNSYGFGNRTADFAPQDNAVMKVKGSFAGVYEKIGSSVIEIF